MVELSSASADDDNLLQFYVDSDRLGAVRRTVLISLPINVILGTIAMLVAINAGRTAPAVLWFAASSVANGLRFLLCRAPLPNIFPQSGGGREIQTIATQLRLHVLTAGLSGLVWAFIPVLCDGLTSPETLFYLTIMCGITAGAVVHGFAFARIPISFIIPPLLSVAGCLVYAGNFDRYALAAAVVLYFGALVRGALESEKLFVEMTRLKNRATAMARSLEAAHLNATEIANEMRHRASHDLLTKLLNRRGFTLEAQNKFIAPHRPLCLMMLDLDGFKAINDAFGHKMGDRVLMEVATRLRETVPDQAIVARLGGDEFAVLYDPRLVDETPDILATRLVTAMTIPFASFDAGRIGVSIGIYESEHDEIDHMLVCADAALYSAKNKGHNQHYIFDDELRSVMEMKRDVERDLAAAISDGLLQVWYQPIVASDGQTLDTVEALLRWNHPRHGWVSPPEVMSVASFSGQLEPLMRFVLDESCSMIRTLQAFGLDHVRVAMNVSPRQMTQIAVDELILTQLRSLDLPTAMLEVEITEETAVDIRAVQHKLHNLTQAGIRIAIDDFGVGYSSLASLRQLNATRVKIDRSFIANITTSDGDQALVKTIISLGQSLGIEVVAEGVETDLEVRQLRRLGCGLLQGYYFGKPMPISGISNWIGKLETKPRNSHTTIGIF